MEYCQICKINIIKRNYARHLETTKHQRNEAIANGEEIEEKIRECDQCEFKTTSRQSLCNHKRTKHRIGIRYIGRCTLCNVNIKDDTEYFVHFLFPKSPHIEQLRPIHPEHLEVSIKGIEKIKKEFKGMYFQREVFHAFQ